jgi:hypothetical protein
MPEPIHLTSVRAKIKARAEERAQAPKTRTELAAGQLEIDEGLLAMIDALETAARANKAERDRLERQIDASTRAAQRMEDRLRALEARPCSPLASQGGRKPPL